MCSVSAGTLGIMASRGRLMADLGRAKIAQGKASTSEKETHEHATENPTTARPGPRRKLNFSSVLTDQRQPLKPLNDNCQYNSQKNSTSLFKDKVYDEISATFHFVFRRLI